MMPTFAGRGYTYYVLPIRPLREGAMAIHPRRGNHVLCCQDSMGETLRAAPSVVYG